ncbi:hypothetical protein ElyMa_006274800 [Elysia marginata]|uniref:Dopey N-terminal domain-containing protein n=1 Tax=Elysia marginata TaxID=1093978 RepID=A0AAV4HBD5_9GAST|nr:hypothetical protein ElyMa_006274800 [Elysia marginata]
MTPDAPCYLFLLPASGFEPGCTDYKSGVMPLRPGIGEFLLLMKQLLISPAPNPTGTALLLPLIESLLGRSRKSSGADLYWHYLRPVATFF